MNYTAQHAERALEIVNRLLPNVTVRTEYLDLIEVLQNQNRWHEGHDLFSRIRVNITLPTEAYKGTGLDDAFVYVAENAAKTSYNCSGRSAPFDNECFARLLKAEQNFLSKLTSILPTNGEQGACTQPSVAKAPSGE